MGAALAWLLRMLLDSAALFALVWRERGGAAGAAAKHGMLVPAALALLAFAGLGLGSAAWRAAWLLMVLAAAATMAASLYRASRPSH